VNAIAAAGITKPYLLNANTVYRMHEGQPKPLQGKVAAVVWSDNGLEAFNSNIPTYLGETYHVYVTVTLRCELGWDSWIQHRDAMEQLQRQIKVVLVQDELTNVIIRAANSLAAFDDFPDSFPTAPVGFRGFLVWAGDDPIEKKGADWLNAQIDDTNPPPVAMVQRQRWGGVKRYQAIATCS
jgi:hypothetical protein